MPDNSGKICFTVVSDKIDSQSLNSLLNYESDLYKSGNWNFLGDKPTAGRITTQHTTHTYIGKETTIKTWKSKLDSLRLD